MRTENCLYTLQYNQWPERPSASSSRGILLNVLWYQLVCARSSKDSSRSDPTCLVIVRSRIAKSWCELRHNAIVKAERVFDASRLRQDQRGPCMNKHLPATPMSFFFPSAQSNVQWYPKRSTLLSLLQLCFLRQLPRTARSGAILQFTFRPITCCYDNFYAELDCLEGYSSVTLNNVYKTANVQQLIDIKICSDLEVPHTSGAHHYDLTCN